MGLEFAWALAGWIFYSNSDVVIIAADDYVFTFGTVTRDNVTTVNGWFEIKNNGYANGSVSMTYSGGGLIFSHNNGTYGVSHGNTFWPTNNGPYNLIINSSAPIYLTNNLGGIRNIAGTATLNAGIYLDYASALSISGTLLIQANGFIGNNSPVYTPRINFKIFNWWRL